MNPKHLSGVSRGTDSVAKNESEKHLRSTLAKRFMEEEIMHVYDVKKIPAWFWSCWGLAQMFFIETI